jgi:hypothetical protein
LRQIGIRGEGRDGKSQKLGTARRAKAHELKRVEESYIWVVMERGLAATNKGEGCFGKELAKAKLS